VRYLDAQPHENILDLGCGDGKLTVEIAKSVPQGQVLGLDSSPSFINSGNEIAKGLNLSNCKFAVEDCAKFSSPDAPKFINGSWDKVFSNAAYHWILRQPETRIGALRAAYDALKPGGKFVFECGGSGNVAEIVVATISGLVTYGVPLNKARELIPWYFATEAWMRSTLKEIGFTVDKLELEYRPTTLTPKDEAGRGGLEGWFRLFGASILEGIDQNDKIIKHVCDLLETVITKEDSTQVLGYVRLRGVATKPTV